MQVLEASNRCFRFRKMVSEASNGFSPVSENGFGGLQWVFPVSGNGFGGLQWVFSVSENGFGGLQWVFSGFGTDRMLLWAVFFRQKRTISSSTTLSCSDSLAMLPAG
jgi:hypothetical protein